MLDRWRDRCISVHVSNRPAPLGATSQAQPRPALCSVPLPSTELLSQLFLSSTQFKNISPLSRNLLAESFPVLCLSLLYVLYPLYNSLARATSSPCL